MLTLIEMLTLDQLLTSEMEGANGNPANVNNDNEDWNEPQEQWWQRLIREQTALIDRIDVPANVKEQLAQTLTAQFETKCSICHLRGHDASACWVNSQMYCETRSKPDELHAWWLVKQAAKEAA